MSLEFAILGFLQSADLSGYDLKTRCFDREAAHFWTADQAQVYRTLDKLEDHGDVTATPKRQRNKPDRKVYSITSQGRSRLQDWASQPHPLPPYRDPFLIQLRFSDSLDAESISNTLQQRRDSHQERLDGLRGKSAELAPGRGKRAALDSELQRMTLDAAIASERATIDWLDQCIETAAHTKTTPGSGKSSPGSKAGRR